MGLHPFSGKEDRTAFSAFYEFTFTPFAYTRTRVDAPGVHAPAQDARWEAIMSCRCLEHSLILLATAPRLTRLTLFHECVPQSEASRWLQSLQHLKHLKHLTAVGPAAAGDALNSMLMVRF